MMAGVRFTISLDPQWELAVDELAPLLEAAIDDGLLTEADVAEVLWKAAVLPWLRIDVE